MSVSIYRNVLTLARVGAVSWSVVLVLWALLVVWIYPSLEDTGVNFEDYLNAMPEQLRASMGIAGEAEAALMFNAGAFTYLGFLNVEYISWLPLLLGIYAVVYCGGLISKEVERGTLDVVLSQPVERTTFLLSKLAGFLTLALAATVASAIAVLLGRGHHRRGRQPVERSRRARRVVPAGRRHRRLLDARLVRLPRPRAVAGRGGHPDGAHLLHERPWARPSGLWAGSSTAPSSTTTTRCRSSRRGRSTGRASQSTSGSLS